MDTYAESGGGGKTRMRDEIACSLLKWEEYDYKDAGGYTGMGVIGACQGRFARTKLIKWPTGHESLVLFMASKF